MGKDAGFMLAAMVPGGSVDCAVLAKAAESADSLAAAFNATPLENAAALGAQAMKGGAMTAFELECDNAVSAYLAGAKMIPFGAEPVANISPCSRARSRREDDPHRPPGRNRARGHTGKAA